MGISSAGIGSGLDVQSIIDSLMAVEKKPLTNLVTKQTEIQSKISAIGTVTSSVNAFKTAVDNLAAASKYIAQKATSSDGSYIKATSTGGVAAGTYTMNVEKIATALKVTSQGYANPTQVLGAGVITIDYGSYSATDGFTPNATRQSLSVTIDSSNNTLEGIRNAINAKNGDVVASIVNDGSAQGYKLVLTSKNTGESNGFTVSVQDADSNNTDSTGLSALAYNPALTQGSGKNLSLVQGAQNAKFDIDGISMERSTNSFSDAIDGLSLTLVKPTTAQQNIIVESDNTQAKFVIADFVSKFNDMQTTIKTLTKFDLENKGKNAGALSTDTSVKNMLSTIKTAVAQQMNNLGISSISDIGVSFQKDGTLLLDDAKLTKSMENPETVRNFFAAFGKSSSSGLGFVSSTKDTKDGTYSVDVGVPATFSSITGSNPPNLTIANGINDVLKVSYQGTQYTIKLDAKTYTSSSDLIQEIQLKFNEAKLNLTASNDGSGNLQLSSNDYGSSTVIGSPSGSAAAGLFGTPTSVSGTDIQGTINGMAATGTGLNLAITEENSMKGLTVKATSNQVGNAGVITFKTGFSSNLADILAKYTDSVNGMLKKKTDTYNDASSLNKKQQDALTSKLDKKQSDLYKQYTALDVDVSKQKQVQAYLTQQLAGL